MKWLKPGKAPLTIEGFPFFEQEGQFRRMMLHPPVCIPNDVEYLNWNTAGGQIRFRGRFKTLCLRVELNATPEMYHMTTVGEGGFDCYLGRDNREPEYFSSVYLNDDHASSYESCLYQGDPADQDVILNFPLYKGVKTIEIGFDDDAVIMPPHPHKNGRFVVYGGSIDQGGCASRPGMAYSNILSRWLDAEFINLGYSGSGRAEDEVAMAIREIPDIGFFIINTAGNCPGCEYLKDHFPRFISILREKYKKTPILVYSLPKRPCDRFGCDSERSNEAKARLLKDIYRNMATGDPHMYFLRSGGEKTFDGHRLEYETTVDGCHPNDYGFMIMAKELYRMINRILKIEKEC